MQGKRFPYRAGALTRPGLSLRATCYLLTFNWLSAVGLPTCLPVDCVACPPDLVSDVSEPNLSRPDYSVRFSINIGKPIRSSRNEGFPEPPSYRLLQWEKVKEAIVMPEANREGLIGRVPSNPTQARERVVRITDRPPHVVTPPYVDHQEALSIRQARATGCCHRIRAL